MQQPKIKRLKIRALRGIPDLLLQLGGSGMVLEGANGSGKSSIVDALEFLLLGSISQYGTRLKALTRAATQSYPLGSGSRETTSQAVLA